VGKYQENDGKFIFLIFSHPLPVWREMASSWVLGRLYFCPSEALNDAML